MFSQPVVFVDIETTGAQARSSRILEVALIRVENGVVVAEYETLLNPGVPIPAFISSLTGIHDHDIVDAPQFEDVADAIKEICDGALFVAHNVSFDYSFVKREFATIGEPFAPKRLCTVRLSRALYPQHRGHSLEKLIARHSIPFQNRHRAKDDAKAIHYFSMIAHKEHGIDAFDAAVSQQLRTQGLPPNFSTPTLDHIPEGIGVYIMKAEDGTILYIGKSIHIRERVREHFASTAVREVRLSQATHLVEAIETSSEFAALLLESKLVKELHPIHNRQLRRNKRYTILMKEADSSDYTRLKLTYGELDSVSDFSHIYGVYEQKSKALRRLNDTAMTFSLCPKLLGLEKAQKACFWYSLGKCKGACIGKEPAERYNLRVELALQHKKLKTWPYKGSVTIPLTESGESVEIDQWRVVNFIDEYGTKDPYDSSDFSLDEYRIIARFLRQYATLKP